MFEQSLGYPLKGPGLPYPVLPFSTAFSSEKCPSLQRPAGKREKAPGPPIPRLFNVCTQRGYEAEGVRNSSAFSLATKRNRKNLRVLHLPHVRLSRPAFLTGKTACRSNGSTLFRLFFGDRLEVLNKVEATWWIGEEGAARPHSAGIFLHRGDNRRQFFEGFALPRIVNCLSRRAGRRSRRSFP